MTIIIPMAGDGSRFYREGIKTPKPLINVEGKSLIEHSVESLGINGRYIFICREYDNPEYNEQLSSIFEKLNVEYREIRIKHLTSGPVETCLLAENILNVPYCSLISSTAVVSHSSLLTSSSKLIWLRADGVS